MQEWLDIPCISPPCQEFSIHTRLVAGGYLSIKGMAGLQRNQAPAFKAMSSRTEGVCYRKSMSPGANFTVKEIVPQIIPFAT